MPHQAVYVTHAVLCWRLQCRLAYLTFATTTWTDMACMTCCAHACVHTACLQDADTSALYRAPNLAANKIAYSRHPCIGSPCIAFKVAQQGGGTIHICAAAMHAHQFLCTTTHIMICELHWPQDIKLTLLHVDGQCLVVCIVFL